MDGLHHTAFPEHHRSSNKIVSNEETYVPRRGDDVRTKPFIPPQTVEQPLPLRTRAPKKRLKKRIKHATLLDRPLFSSVLALLLLVSIVVIIVYFIWDMQRPDLTTSLRTPPLTPISSLNKTNVDEPMASSFSSTNSSQNKTKEPPQANNSLVNEQPFETAPSSLHSETASSPLPKEDAPDQTRLTETPSETPSETVTETSSETMVYERLYTVQPGDTLYRIAMKTYGNKASIETIRAANGLKNNTIYVGQQLKLPSTSSLP